MTEKEGSGRQSPKIEPLGKKHDRVVFSCGDDSLDTYLKKRASQETKKKIATTFVIADRLTGAVIGFYTLAATSILLADLPDKTARKLPKYPHVPAALLGRRRWPVRVIPPTSLDEPATIRHVLGAPASAFVSRSCSRDCDELRFSLEADLATEPTARFEATASGQ